MTKLSFEVPIAHLRDFHEDQDFIFALSHLFKSQDFGEIYRDYINEVKVEGLLTIWLDNSYNETFQNYPHEDLISLAIELEVNRLIVPDRLDWDEDMIIASYKSTIHEISHHTNLLPQYQFKNHQLVVVVDSSVMKSALQFVGAESFAIAYRKRNEPKINWTWDDMTKVHFLGLLNPNEVLTHQPASLDTSMPIKLAMMGESTDEWVRRNCPHIHTRDLGEWGENFFGATLSNAQLLLAKANIKRLRQIIQG